MRGIQVVMPLVLNAGLGCNLLAGIDASYVAICPSEDATCPPCTEAEDCAAAPACHAFECLNNRCELVLAPPRTPCSGGICSDTPPAACVECLQDSDCPGAGYCHAGKCASCSDSLRNGDESQVDCGGSCLGCLGDACTTKDGCVSGSCADGLCCDAPCDGVCTRCERGGLCKSVPQLEDDTSSACSGTQTCNGSDECALAPGQPCVNDVECASTMCMDGVCTGS